MSNFGDHKEKNKEKKAMRREAQTVYLRVLSLHISLALFLSFRLKKKNTIEPLLMYHVKKRVSATRAFGFPNLKRAHRCFVYAHKTARLAEQVKTSWITFFFSCVCVCVYECSGVLFSYCCSSSCVIWGFGKSLQRYRCAKRNRHRNLRNLEDRSKKARITSTKSPHTREVKRCERKGKTRQNKKRQSFLVFRYHMLCVGAIRF